ncbi:hypothetical protein SteCoe_6759 [Stentor coeruleus]|uniref:Guanylate cyclase domain-containing protein n=1 Tax=Stentor coeruleus TaxID=5963 RepID=A0A1R2CP87_9CILI|nr:hypothetical protein SteCoe_6759 [Stentor coeruleus]
MKVYPENYGESIDTKQDKESELLYTSRQVSNPDCIINNSIPSPQIKIENLVGMQTKVYKKLESKGITVLMTIITIYSLYGDDIRISFTSKNSDIIFFSLATVCCFLFLLEIFMMFYAKKHYRWSFYFWLDILATISLIPDIGWLWESIVGINMSGGNLKTKKVQNAIKASRLGTRTSKVVRFIRMFRLFRIVKLYKNAQMLKGNEDFEEEEADDYEKDNSGQAMYVGEKLSELVTKRVISIVLVMLMILPLFDSDFYVSNFNWENDLIIINELIGKNSFEKVKNIFIELQTSTQYPLIHFLYEDNGSDYIWDSGIDYNDLRYEEIYYSSQNTTIAIFDLRQSSQLIGILDISRTIFVTLMFSLGTLFFSRDLEKKIINPIKNMIARIQMISQTLDFNLSHQKTKTQHLKTSKFSFCKDNSKEYLQEIVFIEKTIMQIGILLVLVFGEAGARIIRNSLSLEGELILCDEGVKIYAIFCFCDIRNFTDITEELQEEVMLFINEIAYIIHMYAYIYQGAANKNVGDAFLLVWKVAENTDECLAIDLQISSDLAVLSLVKMITGIRKSPFLLKYRQNLKLNARMTDFDIKIGFGLHMGWAIEGPIGSEYKIDPTYLSPHVNAVAFLENLTKYYGIQCVISENVYQFLSKPLRDKCRNIDRMAQYEFEEIFNIYCFDVNVLKITSGGYKDRARKKIDRKMQKIRRLIKGDASVAYAITASSKSFQTMTYDFTEDFYNTFAKALNFYFDGLWQNSRIAFNDVLNIMPHDGPSLTILNYMKNYNYISPGSWKGVRIANNF